MKNNFKKLLTLVLSIMMALSLTACGSSNDGTSDDSTVTDHGMFNVALTSPFAGFDPLRTNDVNSSYVCVQIYETLYQIEADGSFTPLLATADPVFSEDGLTATIPLREGVTFHDGTPFNADAVINTFDKIKDPEFGSARASLAASIDSVEAVDEHTVQFNLTYPDGVLHAKLAHTNSAIVSPTAQANQDLMVDPVGTGAYKFVSSVSGSNVVLTRNDEYWGEAPAIKDITMTVIAEESTAIGRLQTGETDFMPSLTVESTGRVESMANATVGRADSARVSYMGLRPTSYVNPLMENADFRKAIIMALDKESYVNYILENNGTVAKSVLNPKVLGYTEAAEAYDIGYDLEASKKLIEDNGWADEKIVFLLNSSPAYKAMGEYFHANLTAAGFTNVVLEPVDNATWLTESKLENRYDITLAGWSNVTRDGTECFEPNWGSETSARNKVNSAELDAMILEGKTTTDINDRIVSLEEANIYLLENAYVAPIVNQESVFAYNSDKYADVTLETSGLFYAKNITIAE